MRGSNLMVVQYVHDMPRAVAFYRDAMGLNLISQSSGWSMLSCGDAFVGLHIIEKGVSEGLTPHAGLNLQVEHLESAIEDIRTAGGRLLTVREADLPRVPVRLAEVQNSEGNGFEIRQFVSTP
jgi:predicted enzyme related to lactoylglutathione lyase